MIGELKQCPRRSVRKWRLRGSSRVQQSGMAGVDVSGFRLLFTTHFATEMQRG